MTPVILSLDGGGVRGIIEGVVLQELERTLEVPILKDRFTLMAGSSTGALVACGLALGWDSKKIIELYLTRTQRVFPDSLWSTLKSRVGQFLAGAGVSVPKYSDTELENLLYEYFGNIEFGELNNVLVTSYDIKLRSPVIFKSWNENHKRLLIRDVAKASASAPTYLPSHKMTVEGTECYLIDGGIVANNPSMCAVAEACRLGYTNPVLISIGTGSSLQALNGHGTRDWGIAEWVPHILNSVMDGSSDIATYQACQILGNDRVFRFQFNIPANHSSMDDSSLKNLLFLETLTRKYFRRPEVRIQLRNLKTLINA